MSRSGPGERWYRRLLRLYPTDFRDEFGGEMTRLYRARVRDESWWSLWLSLLLDVVRTAPSEHFTILRDDVRHAGRGFRRTPVITAAAILTLALGIGASTAVYGVVHAVLLRPLPYPEPENLVELFESNSKTGIHAMRVSALNYLSWSERSNSFDAIAAFGSTGMTLTEHGDPEVLGGSFVTASLFDVLRVRPLIGRTLRPEDEQRGSSRVAVIGETLWRTRFGADRTVVGRSVTLDGARYEVVGVMPVTFREVGRQQATANAAGDIFLPMTIDAALENRANHTLRVVARLRRAVSLETARAEMASVASGLEREFPATNAGWSTRIEALADTTVEPAVRRSLLLVLGAVAVAFLIACVNVANLMLARATRRRSELALRTALGAAPSRLVRQLLTESVCLAAISGAAGVLVAALSQPLLRGVLPPTLPRLDELHPDVNVLGFGLATSLLSGIAFGVVPAIRGSRLPLTQSLLLAGRTTDDAPRARLRKVLIAVQIALATMLLVSAGLLLRGFVRLQRIPLGFEPNAVLTARVSLPRSYADANRVGEFYGRLVESIRSSPDIGSVGLATSAPFAPGVRASFQPSNRGRAPASSEGAAEHIVNDEYFRILGIPLLAGRLFNEQDTMNSATVAIASHRAAQLFWPRTNALGQTFERHGRSFEIVGIVGDVRGSDTQGQRGGGLDRAPRAAIYFAAAQSPQRTMTLLVSAGAVQRDVEASLRRALRELDPSLPLRQVRPLHEWIEESIAPTRFATTLAIAFAVCALLLASVGVYGVLAYTVAARTKEIGVRVAIGASRPRVIGLVLREGMMWTGSGILVGMLAAFAVASLLGAVLFETPAHDPVTFAGVGVTMAIVALLACAIPALRAVRIDPTVAMRTE